MGPARAAASRSRRRGSRLSRWPPWTLRVNNARSGADPRPSAPDPRPVSRVRDNGSVSSAQPSDGTDVGAREHRPARPRRLWLFAAVALFALAADLISKALVVANLGERHDPVRILAGAIY